MKQFKYKFRFISSVSIALTTATFLVACGDSSQQKTEKKAQDNGVSQTEIKSQALTAQINLSPLFESAQGWGAGFTKARSKGEGRGVVVGPGADNPNVFAQQFPAKPDEQFKVIARASSVDKPKATGRFQINWINSEKYISSSIKAFEVTPEEKTFETYVTVPAGATAGTLYVVPDGKEDVVRYTEMRVLGKEKDKTN